jgi:hypothetical protein
MRVSAYAFKMESDGDASLILTVIPAKADHRSAAVLPDDGFPLSRE